MRLFELYESTGMSVMGIHYSHEPDLDILLGTKHGTGIAKSEKRDYNEYPEDYVKERVYFYVQHNDKLPKAEAGLGPYVYRAKLDYIYDSSSDSLGLHNKAIHLAREKYSGSFRIIDGKRVKVVDDSAAYPPAAKRGLFGKLVKAKGFKGFTDGNIVVYFGDVKADYLGHVGEL